MSARSSSGATVGRLSTMATMVEPETISGSSQPAVAMIGLSATRTGYFITRRCSSTPLARAVITYCFLSSSSSVLRITRTIAAVPAVPATSTGSGRCSSASTTRATLHGSNSYAGENRPPALMPNSLSRTYISSRASRKFGVARPTKPSTVKP